MLFLVHHRGILSHAMFRRPIGLLKMYATRCAQETATDAVQIFGGRGITKTGMGQYIEHVRLFCFVLSRNYITNALDSITARFPSMQFLAEVGVVLASDSILTVSS